MPGRRRARFETSSGSDGDDESGARPAELEPWETDVDEEGSGDSGSDVQGGLSDIEWGAGCPDGIDSDSEVDEMALDPGEGFVSYLVSLLLTRTLSSGQFCIAITLLRKDMLCFGRFCETHTHPHAR